MNIAYIMRGVSGSGKSTVARCLAGEIGTIHSTDDYFMVNSEYRFDPKKLREYHEQNHTAFCISLAKETEIVICDNTNIQLWQFKKYVNSAEKAGYMVAYVTIPHPDPKIAVERSVHNIPLYAIERMIRDWED